MRRQNSSRNSRILRRPFRIRKQLAESLVLSVFYYNDVVCHPAPEYLKGLIPRQRNTSRETVYAKYGWLHMNNSIEFSLREQKIRFASEYNSVLLTAKAKKVREFNRIIHAQPSVFRINSFSRRISLSWNQALTSASSTACSCRLCGESLCQYI